MVDRNISYGKRAREQHGAWSEKGGFGKTFKLKNNNELSIEVRENLGLSEINDVTVVDNGFIKTNSINLICNYSFNLWKK